MEYVTKIMSVINGWESEKIFCPEKIRFVMNIVHEPWTPKELMSKCEVINNGAKRREMTGRSAVLLSISRHCVEEKDWRRVLRFEDFFFFFGFTYCGQLSSVCFFQHQTIHWNICLSMYQQYHQYYSIIHQDMALQLVLQHNSATTKRKRENN